MRHLERNLEYLNNLLHLNYEVEEIYHEAMENVDDQDLKAFFKNSGFERNEYGMMLRREITKFGGEPILYDGLSRMYKRILMKIKNLIKTDNEEELLNEVCNIEQLSIGAYNIVLQERHVPLSVCKMLIEQRDNIQKTIHTIKVKEQLVA